MSEPRKFPTTSPPQPSSGAAGDRGRESNSDRTDGSGGGPDNSKAGGGVSATPAAQPHERVLGKSPALCKVASSKRIAQLTPAAAGPGSYRTTDSGATFDSIFDEEPECRQPGRAKGSGNGKANGGTAEAGGASQVRILNARSC